MKKTATTAVAAGFPAKTSAARPKLAEVAKASGLIDRHAALEPAKKPTRAKKVASPVEVAGKALAAASTKPMRAKAATKKAVAARPPTVLAKSGKLLGADAKGVPGTKAKPAVKSAKLLTAVKSGMASAKRTVKDTGLPVHDVHDVAGLAKILGTFPRGSTFTSGSANIEIYNLRGRLIAEVRQVSKGTKTARADLL